MKRGRGFYKLIRDIFYVKKGTFEVLEKVGGGHCGPTNKCMRFEYLAMTAIKSYGKT